MTATLLITGSEGYIGSSLLPHLSEFSVVTIDRSTGADVVADLARESDRVRQAVSELRFDALIHLAANPNASVPWEALYEDNVVATIHAYELARDLGIRKVVFASSIHVATGYANHPETWPIGADSIPWPTNAYGVSKVVGESFLQMLCDETPTRGYSLRIAAYWDGRGPLHSYQGADVLFLHADDFADIVLGCLRDEEERGHVTLFCTSRIPQPVVDISETKRVLGYEPRHAAAQFYPALA